MLELRITTGTAKNKKLVTPEIAGFRAVQEVAKQAVFAILEDKVKNAKCLDLFSGSGNMGIEALSRGAASCVFVDDNYEAIGAITQNIQNTQFTAQATVVKKTASKYTAKCAETNQTFNIIFCDPFYQDTAHIFLIKNIETILEKGGILVFFHNTNLDFPALLAHTNLQQVTTRKFGESQVEIVEKIA